MNEREWLDWMDVHWARNSAGRADPSLQERLCQLGMAEEIGEVVGCFKREARGDPRPRETLIKELGDALHYIHRYMQLKGIDPDVVRRVNYNKLVERYGDDQGA